MSDEPITPPETICGYRIHPAANLFPMMAEPELADLMADIKANGQRVPINYIQTDDAREPTRDNTIILDGRNRLLACERAGVQPIFREVGLYECQDHGEKDIVA